MFVMPPLASRDRLIFLLRVDIFLTSAGQHWADQNDQSGPNCVNSFNEIDYYDISAHFYIVFEPTNQLILTENLV